MQTSYELEANFSLQWNLLSWSWREINRLAFWILSIALSMSAAIIKWILTSFVIRLPCFFVLYWPELFHDFIPGTISIWVSDSQFKGIRHQKYFHNNLAPIAECVTHIFHNQGQFYCYPYTEDHYTGGGGVLKVCWINPCWAFTMAGDHHFHRTLTGRCCIWETHSI